MFLIQFVFNSDRGGILRVVIGRQNRVHNLRGSSAMTYVVTENCIKCVYTDCVDVCPVDCFREGPNMLVIDPEECIDCTLCVPECPADAIFLDEEVPTGQEQFIEINARLSKIGSRLPLRKMLRKMLISGRTLPTSINTLRNNFFDMGVVNELGQFIK